MASYRSRWSCTRSSKRIAEIAIDDSYRRLEISSRCQVSCWRPNVRLSKEAIWYGVRRSSPTYARCTLPTEGRGAAICVRTLAVKLPANEFQRNCIERLLVIQE